MPLVQCEFLKVWNCLITHMSCVHCMDVGAVSHVPSDGSLILFVSWLTHCHSDIRVNGVRRLCSPTIRSQGGGACGKGSLTSSGRIASVHTWSAHLPWASEEGAVCAVCTHCWPHDTGAELRDCGEESGIDRDSLTLPISAVVEMREEEDSSDLLCSLGP